LLRRRAGFFPLFIPILFANDQRKNCPPFEEEISPFSSHELSAPLGLPLCNPDSGVRSLAPEFPREPGPSPPGWTSLISGLGIGIGIGTHGTDPCDSGLRPSRTRTGFCGASPCCPVVTPRGGQCGYSTNSGAIADTVRRCCLLSSRGDLETLSQLGRIHDPPFERRGMSATASPNINTP
jgi:hypothetical protein